MAWIDILVFTAGGAAVWFGKDTLLKWYQGAETFAKNLEAKAAAIKAKVSTVKTAVTK